MDYDSIAQAYQSYGQKALTDWEFGYKQEGKMLEPLAGKIVLDFGCGEGKFSRWLASQGAEVFGLDTSAKMIELAKRQNSENVQYFHTQPHAALEMEAEKFDAATINFVFCTFPSKELIQNALKEINRVLKRQGELLILNTNWNEANGQEFSTCKLLRIDKLESGKEIKIILKGENPITITDYYWSIRDYSDILSSAGFKLCEVVKLRAQVGDSNWDMERLYPPMIIIRAVKK